MLGLGLALTPGTPAIALRISPGWPAGGRAYMGRQAVPAGPSQSSRPPASKATDCRPTNEPRPDQQNCLTDPAQCPDPQNHELSKSIFFLTTITLLSVQVSGVKYMHIVVHQISIIFSSYKSKTLATKQPPSPRHQPPAPSPQQPSFYSPLCSYRCDFSRDLTQGESCSTCLFVSGLFR